MVGMSYQKYLTNKIKTVIPPNLIESSQHTCNLYYTKREECYTVQSYCSGVDTQNTASMRESTLLHSSFFLSIDIFKQKIAYMIFGSYLYWIATDLKLVQVEITDSNVYPQSFNCTLVHMWRKENIQKKDNNYENNYNTQSRWRKVTQLKRNYKIWFILSENSLEQLISENTCNIFPHFWNFYAKLNYNPLKPLCLSSDLKN